MIKESVGGGWRAGSNSGKAWSAHDLEWWSVTLVLKTWLLYGLPVVLAVAV